MSKKIKVMNMIPHLGAGGAQRIVLDYLKYFSDDKDIDFCLLVYSSQSQSIYDRIVKKKGYNVIYLNNPHLKIRIPFISRFIDNLIACKKIKEEIKRFQPDIIHSHISTFLKVVLKPVQECNIPVRFSTLHSNPYRMRGYTLKCIRNAFNYGGFIPICLNEEQKNMAQKHYCINNYEILHNGLDFNEIDSRIIKKEDARKKFNLSMNSYVIIGVRKTFKGKKF